MLSAQLTLSVHCEDLAVGAEVKVEAVSGGRAGRCCQSGRMGGGENTNAGGVGLCRF